MARPNLQTITGMTPYGWRARVVLWLEIQAYFKISHVFTNPSTSWTDWDCHRPARPFGPAARPSATNPQTRDP